MNKALLKKLLRFTLVLVAVLLLGAGALFLAIVQPGGDGVLTSLRLSDGSEYLVTQRCNWSGEPYTVAFYMRRTAGEPWGWCYIDHQASRWWNVSMRHDPQSDRIIVTKRGEEQAVLDRRRGTFWIAHFSREVEAPQDYGTPEFALR